MRMAKKKKVNELNPNPGGSISLSVFLSSPASSAYANDSHEDHTQPLDIIIYYLL